LSHRVDVISRDRSICLHVDLSGLATVWGLLRNPMYYICNTSVKIHRYRRACCDLR
jgi:hypothetical protein